MADHLVDPGKQHMAAMAHLALDRAAAPRLVVLELVAKRSDFACGQRIDREMIASVAVAGDLGLAQHPGHAFAPFIPVLDAGNEAWRPVQALSSSGKRPVLRCYLPFVRGPLIIKSD